MSEIYVIECPHCERSVDSILKRKGINGADISHWYYERDLYALEETKKVTCPGCNEEFVVKINPSISYESAKTEDDL